MRYRTLTSCLSMLKLTTGKSDIDQLAPELVQMIPMVERNLGLDRSTLPKRTHTADVKGSYGDLPIDFFEEQDIDDACLLGEIPDSCNCNCVPCRCGFGLRTGCADFTFHDTTIQCPFKTGTVTFNYWALEMGSDGMPMILDGHVEAFMAYVSKVIKKGEMNAGLVAPQIYEVNKRDWGEESLFTRSRDKLIKQREMERITFGPRCCSFRFNLYDFNACHFQLTKCP